VQVLPSPTFLITFDGCRSCPFHGLRFFSITLGLKLGRLSTLPFFDRPSGFGYELE
jgi:hypothetical protein